MLDSSVLIDVLRGYAPAEAWLGQQAQLGTTRIVWLELLEGAPNKHAQQRAIRLLRRFAVVDHTPDDMQWAVAQLTQYGLSHNVDAFDCLMASTSQYSAVYAQSEAFYAAYRQACHLTLYLTPC